MKHIFVYGTLKKGYWNHRLIEHCEQVHDNYVVSGFELYESGIPFMKRSRNPEDQVLGEVYAVDEGTLRRVDGLEGHPTGYNRQVVSIPSNGIKIEGYLYPHPMGANALSPKIDGVYVYGRGRDW